MISSRIKIDLIFAPKSPITSDFIPEILRKTGKVEIIQNRDQTRMNKARQKKYFFFSSSLVPVVAARRSIFLILLGISVYFVLFTLTIEDCMFTA